jgi:hypothetical protein
MAMRHSLMGTGDHWDPFIACNKPLIASERTLYAGEILGHVQEDLAHVIPCAYEGDDLAHPDAKAAIASWCEMRAAEAAEELAGLPIDSDGMVSVQRIMSCTPQTLRNPVGIFWSTDVEHGGILSPPWGSSSGPATLLTARISHEDVDWQTSCIARMDWYSGPYEKELRLHPGRPLHSVRAHDWNQSLIRIFDDPRPIQDLDWRT